MDTSLYILAWAILVSIPLVIFNNYFETLSVYLQIGIGIVAGCIMIVGSFYTSSPENKEVKS